MINYCDFQDTGKTFQHKRIYKCSYCGLTLSLENPDAKILCFKKQNDFLINMENQFRDPKDHLKADHITKDQLHAYIDKDSEKHIITEINNTSGKELHLPLPSQEDSTEAGQSNICTKEQVDNRLAICHGCKHFKDNTCLLCGCTVVRETNFNNKLAHKDASCPINKWGPIKDEQNA